MTVDHHMSDKCSATQHQCVIQSTQKIIIPQTSSILHCITTHCSCVILYRFYVTENQPSACSAKLKETNQAMNAAPEELT